MASVEQPNQHRLIKRGKAIKGNRLSDIIVPVGLNDTLTTRRLPEANPYYLKASNRPQRPPSEFYKVVEGLKLNSPRRQNKKNQA